MMDVKPLKWVKMEVFEDDWPRDGPRSWSAVVLQGGHALGLA